MRSVRQLYLNGRFWPISAGHVYELCWSSPMQMTGQVECKWVGKSVQLPIDFNPSAIVPNSHDLHACGLDTLIVLAWLLVEVIVVRIVATLIHAWGYQRFQSSC